MGINVNQVNTNIYMCRRTNYTQISPPDRFTAFRRAHTFRPLSQARLCSDGKAAVHYTGLGRRYRLQGRDIAERVLGLRADDDACDRAAKQPGRL